MLPSNLSQRDPPLGSVVLEAPFHFIISRAIPCTNPDSPEQCLHLPPSLLLGDEFFDEATGKLFAQPNITYYLRAIANFTINDTGAKGSQETFLPVTVAPHTEELPPTETDDFPMEFKEQEIKVLRRSLLGTPLGTMKVSLQEPSALAYDTRSTHSHTTALLRLEFESASSSSNDVPKSLQGLSFTVFSLVRVKTFYSVKSFPRLPSQSLLESFGDMRLRDGIIKLETQHVRDASWGYRFNPESQATATQASLASLSRSIEGVLDGGNTRKPMTSEPGGKWISNWAIPIEVNGRLLPTFCSSLVARFYTLIVRVKVAGARQEAFDFEVPFQVIHTPPGKTDSSPPPVEEIREQFLQYQRASEAFWFSEDSLVSCLRGQLETQRLINR